MNTVWVVTGGYDYEGEQVVSVWLTEAEAESEAERMREGDSHFYDFINVEPYEVGKPWENPECV